MHTLSGPLGFLGYGNMGAAIAAGLVEGGVAEPSRLCVYDPAPERMALAESLGLAPMDSVESLTRACDSVMLAVKPQRLDSAIAPMLDIAPPDMRVISIMAGVTIAALESRFGARARITRVMPNTPALVGAGAAALAFNASCDDDDMNTARTVFEAVGIVEVVPESYMDAVTALSGSGPAYFFYFAECLAAAGVAEGLPEEVARRLAGQTLYGAGKLLVTSGKSPDVLREQVTSKGGTTFAALEQLRACNFAGTIAEACHAAAERSRELGGGK